MLFHIIVSESYRNMSDPGKFKVTQLKEQLQKRQLSTAGCKTELIARLQRADPEGYWIQELETNVVSSGGEDAVEDVVPSQVSAQGNRDSEDVLRELEFLRREQRLMERELRLAERENEILRNRASNEGNRPEVQTRINKAVSELLSEFDGSEDLFKNWEKQIKLLSTTSIGCEQY